MPLNISVCCLRSSIRGIKKILGPSYFRFKVSDFTFFLHKRLFWPAYFPLEQWMACALRPTLARWVMGFLPSNKEEGRKKACKQERKSVRAKSDSREEANWVGRSVGQAEENPSVERVFFLHAYEKTGENTQRGGQRERW